MRENVSEWPVKDKRFDTEMWAGQFSLDVPFRLICYWSAYPSEETIVLWKKMLGPNIIQIPLEVFALQSFSQLQTRADLLFVSQSSSLCEIIRIRFITSKINRLTVWSKKKKN